MLLCYACVHLLAEALARLTMDDLLAGFKADTAISLIGLQDRFDLLKHLAQAIQRRPDYFGGEEGLVPRPGNMMGNYTSYIRRLQKEGRGYKGRFVARLICLYIK